MGMALDFTPNIHSVYFNSLRQNPSYSNILWQGQKYLNKNPFDATKDLRAEQKIKAALTVLQNGINKERATEQQYTQNLIKSIKNPEISTVFSQKLKSIFNGNDFDYIEFINLINSILLGTENYQAVLSLEKKRLANLDDIYKKLIDTTDKTEEAIAEEQQKIRNIYLERHSLSNSEYSSHFANITPTIDYLLAQYISNISDKILRNKELGEIIKKQIISQQRNDQEVGTYILNNVIKQVNEQIPIIVKAALEDNAASIDELLEKIEIDQFSHIEINGQKVDFGISKKSVKNITINRKEKDLEKIISTKGNDLAKLLLEVAPKLNRQDQNNLIVNILNKKIKFNEKNDSSVFELIDKLQTLIEQLENAQSELKKIKDHGDRKGNRESIENIIQNNNDAIPKLKRRISAFVHGEIKALINAEVTDQAKVLAAEKIREILTPTVISITGPEYSELVDTVIQKVGTSIFTGPQNVKADTINIQLSLGSVRSAKKFEDKKIIKAVNAAFKNSESSFYQTFLNELPKAGQSTSYAQGRSAWQAAIRNQRRSVLKNLDFNAKTEDEQIKIMQQLAKQMQESIVVTETMKTFNQYNNDIGFLSGSLGSNAAVQVGNFAELFEKAGIPMDNKQQEWLITALVNCSPATIGEHNKQPLEKYLSLMAGFAVFDEGSAEIEMLANQAQQEYMDYSPQIMHLYKLNGMYFPGSYVLQRIYDNLEREAIEADNEITNNDGAIISSSASEELIGSHKQDSGAARWARVYEEAKEVTSISVAFLSGLMNVVDQLFAAFSNP